MTNITKKQATLAVIAVVLATAMIASVVSSNSVFAWGHHHKSNHKSINVSNEQNQRSLCVTGGGHSSISGDACRNTSTSRTSSSGGKVL